MSELTILKAMKKDLELMLKREEDRGIYDEQLPRENWDVLEEIIEKFEEVIDWEPTDAQINDRLYA